MTIPTIDPEKQIQAKQYARIHRRVWLLDTLLSTLYLLAWPQTLKPIRVHTGLTDGTFTEVVGDSLREGTPVVLGLDLSGAPAASGQVNPFAPRFPGGRR